MLNTFRFLSKDSRSRVIYVLIALLVTLLLFVDDLPIRVNLSASMPRGIYWLTRHSIVNAGDFVMVCLSNPLAYFALTRGYLRAGSCSTGVEPLFKEVVAKNKDRVELQANAVVIHHQPLPHSATFTVDSLHRPLPAIVRGVYNLQTNQFWLYGTESAKSWDSRYFGVVDRSSIVRVVKPLVVLQEVNKV
jgi:conjugative transfer signal peptidase TraF